MMPELKALFDSPQRLLPGKGARMQGYGDKQTISGVASSGANGVYTLARSEKSGLTPQLGTAEQPVELRAGPGVRLHGYGGIHTLERLPVQIEEEKTPLGPARLEWEIERSQGFCQVCDVGASYATPSGYCVERAITYNFTEGSFVETETASGVTTPYGPNDTPPGACAALVYDSTEDPEKEGGYGDFIDSSVEETFISKTSVGASAIAIMDVWSNPTVSQEWVENTWKNVSEGVTPFTTYIGAYAEIGLDYGNPAEARSVRFRLKNSGSVSLRVNCGFYGSGLSGGASNIESIIDLSPGASSAWQTPPSPDLDSNKFRSAEIRRVRIGRYRTVP
jgi:hypothetical protein